MTKIQLLITTKCVHVVSYHDILFNIVSCLLFFSFSIYAALCDRHHIFLLFGKRKVIYCCTSTEFLVNQNIDEWRIHHFEHLL